MAYDFEFSDAADRIQFESHTDFTSYVSVSLWLYAESNPGTNQTIYIQKHKSGANTDKNFFFNWTPAGGGDVYVGWSRSDTGANNEWKIDYTPSTSAWTHFYFSIDWTTNPDVVRIWANGVEQSVAHNFGSTNIGPLTTATQVYSIGGPPAGDPNFTDGLLAEIGIWNDLVPSRVEALAKGYSPLFYANNLEEYFPLIRELINPVGGGTGTASGTPVVAAHPRMIYPTKIQLAHIVAAAPQVSDFLPRLALLGVG